MEKKKRKKGSGLLVRTSFSKKKYVSGVARKFDAYG
jgi:hypothetical protein